MRYKVISAVLLIALIALCIGQEKPPEEEPEEEPEVTVEEILPETLPPVPDDVLKGIIRAYFDALNQRDLNTLQELTHPYYAADAPLLMQFVSKNNISLELTSVSMLMKENSFKRDMLKTMTEEEFAQKVGVRGVSYELELILRKQDTSFPDCFLFIELGETEDGWKILDPAMFQIVLEEYLEILELEEEE